MATATKTSRSDKQNNNFARAAPFISLPLFWTTNLHDYNVKLPETSQLHVLWRTNVVFVPVNFFFSLPLIFTSVAASISHFLTTAIKFSRFSSNEIGLLCFLSLALALSLLSTLMQTLKFSRKKESALLLLYFFSLKVRVAMRFSPEPRGCLKRKISPWLT